MRISSEQFTIGWICAVSVEYALARELLDEEYQDDQIPSISRHNDSNIYTFGRVHKHDIVIACLPQGRYGNTSAAIVASNLLSSFPAVRFALLVGIAGGAPSQKHDVRLDDVIIGTPTPGFGGVIQYDYGKALDGVFVHTGYTSPPPPQLLNAVTKLKGIHQQKGHKIATSIANMLKHNKRLQSVCNRPDPDTDKLYQVSSSGSEEAVHRTERDLQDEPIIHHGLIASANQLMKNRKARDELIDRYDILCFEMEAAGVVDSLPCLVIRGICDYSDSHKNDIWQGYAAATAAAYAKELLEIIPQQESRTLENAQDSKPFNIPLSLQGVPLARRFIDRPVELQKLHETLLPAENVSRRKIHVLRGMGGIGKTQLAVEFMRRYQNQFSSIFWLDGSSEDSLKTSLAQQLAKLPFSRTMNPKNFDPRLNNDLSPPSVDIDAQVVLKWLCSKGNDRWLLIFDNVDRKFEATDPSSYDIQKHFPVCDHGAILITTRLSQLEHLGDSQELKTVEFSIAKSTFKTWYKGEWDETELVNLLSKLDGLPLAIAQAAAFIQESGTTVKTYIELYEKQWSELVQPGHDEETVLTDYGSRSIWTTWAISYNSICAIDRHAANLLLLWSCINNNDLWYDIFEKALCHGYVAQQISDWIGDIASNRVSFIKTMRTLRSYSIVEGIADNTDSYKIHGVLHNWVYFAKGRQLGNELAVLAVLIVGIAARLDGNLFMARALASPRLFPHAEVCYSRLDWSRLWESNQHEDTEKSRWLRKGIQGMGRLFASQDKFEESEKMLLQALISSTGSKEILCNELGFLYFRQHRFKDAEEMFNRVVLTACSRHDEELGDIILLATKYLGIIHMVRCKFKDAEDMFLRVLHAHEDPANEFKNHPIMHSLGHCYFMQRRFDDAEKILLRGLKDPENREIHLNASCLGDVYIYNGRYDDAEKLFLLSLENCRELYGAKDQITLGEMQKLGTCYRIQGKLDQAEEMLSQALEGYKEELGLTQIQTLRTIVALSELYYERGNFEKAEKLCLRVTGGETALQQSWILKIKLVLGEVYIKKGRLEEAAQCVSEALDRALDLLDPEILAVSSEALHAVKFLGQVYSRLSRADEAKDIYNKALEGFTKTVGPDSSEVTEIVQLLHTLEPHSTVSTSRTKLNATRRFKGRIATWLPALKLKSSARL